MHFVLKNGKMARDWGGKIMTIKFVEFDSYRMEEDYDYSTNTKGWY